MADKTTMRTNTTITIIAQTGNPGSTSQMGWNRVQGSRNQNRHLLKSKSEKNLPDDEWSDRK